jgi:hypothetical protein
MGVYGIAVEKVKRLQAKQAERGICDDTYSLSKHEPVSRWVFREIGPDGHHIDPSIRRCARSPPPYRQSLEHKVCRARCMLWSKCAQAVPNIKCPDTHLAMRRGGPCEEAGVIPAHSASATQRVTTHHHRPPSSLPLCSEPWGCFPPSCPSPSGLLHLLAWHPGSCGRHRRSPGGRRGAS